MRIQRMAFRDVYQLFTDCWRLYQKYAARRLSEQECEQIMQEVERLREKYNSDLAKDILIALLRELEKCDKWEEE